MEIIQYNFMFYFFESIIPVSTNFLSHLFYAIIKKYLIDSITTFKANLSNLILAIYVEIIQYNYNFYFFELKNRMYLQVL